MTFVPHAILLAIAYLWLEGVYVPAGELAFAVVAALLPFWAIWAGRRQSLGRALLLGPGTAILAALGVLGWWWRDEHGGPFAGLMILVAAAGLVLYAGYCLVVFSVAGWVQRRRNRASRGAGA